MILLTSWKFGVEVKLRSRNILSPSSFCVKTAAAGDFLVVFKDSVQTHVCQIHPYWFPVRNIFLSLLLPCIL